MPVTNQDKIIAAARRLSFIRETSGANRGLWVQFIQRFTGNAPGDSWCASFVSMVLDIAYEGHAPLKRTASCAEMLASAPWQRTHRIPNAGDIFFYLDANGHAHHVGIVTSVTEKSVIGIAGNTSEDGQSSNGDGVYEHAINTAHVVYVDLP